MGVGAVAARRRRLSIAQILIICLAVLLTFFSITSGDFLQYSNLVSMMTNISFLGLTAMGFCLNLVAGEVDISIGANIALTSCVTAYAYGAGLPIAFCITGGLLVGVLAGIVNAFVITTFKVNSLIVTLGTMSILKGIAYTLTKGQSVLILEDTLGFFGRGELGPVPFPIVVTAAIAVLFHFVLNRTKFGKQVKAVGSSEKVAFLSGIRTKRIKFATIILCSVMASVSGLLIASLSAVGMPQHGIGQEFTVMSAVILGGASLSGGKGSIVGSLIGILIMAVVYNGLVMLNIPSNSIEMIRGLILIVIVASYELRDRKKR